MRHAKDPILSKFKKPLQASPIKTSQKAQSNHFSRIHAILIHTALNFHDSQQKWNICVN